MSATLSPTRRSFVRAAAWSVPVISVGAAAPAFATSPCQLKDVPFRLNWGTSTWDRNADGSGGIAYADEVGTLGANDVAVTFTSAYIRSSGGDRRASDNLTVPALTNVGGVGAGERALLLHHLNFIGNRDYRQEVTFKFDRDVTGLTFTISDVDSDKNDWWDRVELDGLRTGARATGVVGAGLNENATNDSTGPWRLKNDNTQFGSTSSSGNVVVTYSGTILANTLTKLTYWSADSGPEQLMFLSDFRFTAKGC